MLRLKFFNKCPQSRKQFYSCWSSDKMDPRGRRLYLLSVYRQYDRKPLFATSIISERDYLCSKLFSTFHNVAMVMFTRSLTISCRNDMDADDANSSSDFSSRNQHVNSLAYKPFDFMAVFQNQENTVSHEFSPLVAITDKDPPSKQRWASEINYEPIVWPTKEDVYDQQRTGMDDSETQEDFDQDELMKDEEYSIRGWNQSKKKSPSYHLPLTASNSSLTKSAEKQKISDNTQVGSLKFKGTEKSTKPSPTEGKSTQIQSKYERPWSVTTKPKTTTSKEVFTSFPELSAEQSTKLEDIVTKEWLNQKYKDQIKKSKFNGDWNLLSGNDVHDFDPDYLSTNDNNAFYDWSVGQERRDEDNVSSPELYSGMSSIDWPEWECKINVNKPVEQDSGETEKNKNDDAADFIETIPAQEEDIVPLDECPIRPSGRPKLNMKLSALKSNHKNAKENTTKENVLKAFHRPGYSTKEMSYSQKLPPKSPRRMSALEYTNPMFFQNMHSVNKSEFTLSSKGISTSSKNMTAKRDSEKIKPNEESEKDWRQVMLKRLTNHSIKEIKIPPTKKAKSDDKIKTDDQPKLTLYQRLNLAREGPKKKQKSGQWYEAFKKKSSSSEQVSVRNQQGQENQDNLPGTQ